MPDIAESTYYRMQHVTGPGCVLVSIKFGVTPESGVRIVKRLAANQDNACIQFDLQRYIDEIIEGVHQANVQYSGDLQVEEIEVVPDDYPKPGQVKYAACKIAEHLLLLR